MKKYLSKKEAYGFTYNFLSSLYFQNLNDDLRGGGFLGSMSPEIWTDKNSGDINLYNQWLKIANEISSFPTLTLKESFLIMIKFLNIQYELFDEVCVKNLVDEIASNKKYFKKWIKFEV